jgi:hypothetical protein
VIAEPGPASLRGQLTVLLRELAPGRDGRAAFTELCRHVRAERFHSAMPWLIRRVSELVVRPGNSNRSLLVLLLTEAAGANTRLRAPARNPVVQRELDAVVPTLVGFVGDADPAVRRVAPDALCVVLGRIGPPARVAVDALERLATGRRRPPHFSASATRWHGRQHAAWALWRITGAAEPALSLLGQAVRRGPGHAVLSYLAELGPLAAAHAEPVRRLHDGPGGWSRVEAAHAWWRITGDPAPAVPVLIAATEPLRHRRTGPLVRAAVRYLGAIGGPAEAALPLLDAALDGDRRLRDPHGRRPIYDDDALVADARTAADRIRQRARPIAERDNGRPGSGSGAGFGTAG